MGHDQPVIKQEVEKADKGDRSRGKKDDEVVGAAQQALDRTTHIIDGGNREEKWEYGGQHIVGLGGLCSQRKIG